MNTTKWRIALIILVLGFSSCKKLDKNGNEIKEFEELKKANWILGNWEKTDSLGTLKEQWKLQNDSSFIGNSNYIQNEKDTLHFEAMELTEINENLIYEATVKGENNDESVPFKMTKSTDSVLVFENPKHDYPQKITYKLINANNIVATIAGKINGKSSTESYPMTKTK
ncbi:DUF6265 family protein [Flavobacterium sp. SUN046]|uniref:DUF6265 family protein n=1 Tax=Flavobacterium sp. SUN046 TaxID=3002440 RepID=UPI002DBCBD7C|nr:DUF6265 family protein [Flavobacterium sp. SUN046]MEC4049062.1 DUF6265 family protein [Flavobacterium sp. SUN046]